MVGSKMLFLKLVLKIFVPLMLIETLTVLSDQVVSLSLLVLVNELVRVTTCTGK